MATGSALCRACASLFFPFAQAEVSGEAIGHHCEVDILAMLIEHARHQAPVAVGPSVYGYYPQYLVGREGAEVVARRDGPRLWDGLQLGGIECCKSDAVRHGWSALGFEPDDDDGVSVDRFVE